MQDGEVRILLEGAARNDRAAATTVPMPLTDAMPWRFRMPASRRG